MTTYTIKPLKASTRWADVVKSACKALSTDAKLDFVTVAAHGAKSAGSVGHVAKVLKTFPALNTTFESVRLIADDDTPDAIGIARRVIAATKVEAAVVEADAK